MSSSGEQGGSTGEATHWVPSNAAVATAADAAKELEDEVGSAAVTAAQALVVSASDQPEEHGKLALAPRDRSGVGAVVDGCFSAAMIFSKPSGETGIVDRSKLLLSAISTTTKLS
jgi:hypothetical protein